MCTDCGYVHSTLRINGENQEKYFDANFTLQDDIFTRFYEQLNVKRRLREIEPFVPEGHIVEVGVGRGNLFSALRDKGYHVDGVDISRALCRMFREQSGIDIYCGSLEKYAETVSPNTYDAIIMSHVLEHVESLETTLEAIKYLLKPMGIFYVAIPNLSCWDAHWPGWAGYEPYHIHYFNPRNLRRLLGSANFRVVYERTFESVSGWFNAIVRSVRYRTPNLNSLTYSSNRNIYGMNLMWTFYNVLRISSGILLSPIRWLQSGIGYGEELVMIARKG